MSSQVTIQFSGSTNDFMEILVSGKFCCVDISKNGSSICAVIDDDEQGKIMYEMSEPHIMTLIGDEGFMQLVIPIFTQFNNGYANF